jgi:hypothetical protein
MKEYGWSVHRAALSVFSNRPYNPTRFKKICTAVEEKKPTYHDDLLPGF